MSDEMKEYVIFTITKSDGQEATLAVVDEFQYENKDYVAAALVDGDTINEDGIYIYKVKSSSEEFEVEKLTNRIDYEKIAKAYMEIE